MAALNRPPKPPKTPELGLAESTVRACLGNGDYEAAIRTVAAYELRQPVARGIGVDWSRPDVVGDGAALRSIFEGGDGPSQEIRTAAAMMFLWGVSKPFRRWLAREANGDGEATKLVLRAYAARQLALNARARRLGFIP